MNDSVVLRWRVGGLLLAVLVIVALPYAMTRSGVRDALKAGEQVTRSSEVKSLTYQIAYETRDSEAALYRMLDGDADAQIKVRSEQAYKDVPGLLGKLRGMTRDNPDQQVLIGALGARVDVRLERMQQAILQYRRGDMLAAKQAMRDAGTLFKMDDVIEGIVRNEDGTLLNRRTEASRQSFNSGLVFGITAVAQIVLLAIVVIVSERQIGRRLRAEVRESLAVKRSQLIVQAVREPIALLDAELQTLLVNAAFGELYGLSYNQGHAQAQSLPLAELGYGAWSDSALLQRLNDVLLLDRELWDYELIQRTVDGIDRHVVINARRLEQDDGGAPVLLLTVSDITARALVEHQVKELNRQLEGKVQQVSDVNRELEAFSYSVSHDLRAPLRHIAGFTDKLQRHLSEQADESSKHYLQVISDAAHRMALLIDDLLVFSRLGRGALRLQPVDMRALVDEARVLVEPETQGRQVVWAVEPLPIVIGDENMLRTVWQNMLGNAVKYTSQCEVARIEVSTQRGPNGDYEFIVADNGAGFDMQYADKLFGVFQRLHRASQFPGNGIGLANVQRIITRHGGRIWANAELGKGAHFHFTLPASDLAETFAQERA
ncbi:ATP-binding protein [Dyella tabacisoli]|uniref:histidine kinase n=1 Tax=Dyella tabacisoli TaxID=2282381 RepID=A0A369ULD0_9GAMM|nr:ATP-binding protein [Dyella tabacisoli]RDD80528.1 histidine kinase [Dyella tabacisoli]